MRPRVLEGRDIAAIDDATRRADSGDARTASIRAGDGGRPRDSDGRPLGRRRRRLAVLAAVVRVHGARRVRAAVDDADLLTLSSGAPKPGATVRAGAACQSLGAAGHTVPVKTDLARVRAGGAGAWLCAVSTGHILEAAQLRTAIGLGGADASGTVALVAPATRRIARSAAAVVASRADLAAGAVAEVGQARQPLSSTARLRGGARSVDRRTRAAAPTAAGCGNAALRDAAAARTGVAVCAAAAGTGAAGTGAARAGAARAGVSRAATGRCAAGRRGARAGAASASVARGASADSERDARQQDQTESRASLERRRPAEHTSDPTACAAA